MTACARAVDVETATIPTSLLPRPGSMAAVSFHECCRRYSRRKMHFLYRQTRSTALVWLVTRRQGSPVRVCDGLGTAAAHVPRTPSTRPSQWSTRKSRLLLRVVGEVRLLGTCGDSLFEQARLARLRQLKLGQSLSRPGNGSGERHVRHRFHRGDDGRVSTGRLEAAAKDGDSRSTLRRSLPAVEKIAERRGVSTPQRCRLL